MGTLLPLLPRAPYVHTEIDAFGRFEIPPGGMQTPTAMPNWQARGPERVEVLPLPVSTGL